MTFYRSGREERDFDYGIEKALRAMLVSPDFLFRIEQDPAGSRARQRVSHQRSGTGVAAVLLPVEQHSRRRAAGPGREGQAEGPGRARPAGTPHAGRSARGSAGHQFRRAVALHSQSRAAEARPGRLPRVRRKPAPELPAGDRAVLPEHRARGPQRDGTAGRELHVPQSAPGGALRHPECLRRAVPQGDADRSESRRPAGAGKHADGDLVSQPHVGGAARQVDSGQPAGFAAAAAAAEFPT